MSYPEAYPDVAPHLDITTIPNAPRHPLLDVSEDKTVLLQSLDEVVKESLGMAMIFTLVTTLKESAEQLILDRKAALEARKDQELLQAEEEENKKFYGTVVTRERFLEWREKFVAEMAEKERLEKEEKEMEERKKKSGSGKVEERKLTGRQLWERGLVGKVDEDDEAQEGQGDDAASAIDAVEKLKIGA